MGKKSRQASAILFLMPKCVVVAKCCQDTVEQPLTHSKPPTEILLVVNRALDEVVFHQILSPCLPLPWSIWPAMSLWLIIKHCNHRDRISDERISNYCILHLLLSPPSPECLQGIERIHLTNEEIWRSVWGEAKMFEEVNDKWVSNDHWMIVL